jgi:hypothetical protein
LISDAPTKAQIRSAVETLRHVWEAFHVAQEMGARLGECAPLFRPLSTVAWHAIARSRIAWQKVTCGAGVV